LIFANTPETARCIPASALEARLPPRDSRAHNYPPRWNAAPSQKLLVIYRQS